MTMAIKMTAVDLEIHKKEIPIVWQLKSKGVTLSEGAKWQPRDVR